MCNKWYIIFLVALVASCTCEGSMYKLGLENIPLAIKKRVQHASVALIADQAACNGEGIQTFDCLKKQGIFISKLFIDTDIVPGSTLSVARYDASKLEKECKDIQVFIVDLTDFGLQCSPSLATLADLLLIASKYNKEVVVLDRPNPLGFRIEGPIKEQSNAKGHRGIPVPFRHGLTLGELAWFLNMHYVTRPVKLHVVCMKGYQRDDSDATDPTSVLQAMRLFNDLEPLSVSNGQLVVPVNGLAPALCYSFVESLQCFSLSAIYQEQLGEVHISCSSNNMSYTRLLFHISDFLNNHAVKIQVMPTFDNIFGISSIREYVEGVTSLKTVADRVNNELAWFYRNVRSSFMYTPLPVVCELGILG